MTRFVDQASILVQAGRGGNGCRSFYQDLWSRNPVPDGGDGGRGGHVVLRSTAHQTTLLDFQTRRHFRGQAGGHASSKKKQGARGRDCVIEVPLGTLIFDAKAGELIGELLRPGEEVVVARGGAGGIGNAAQKRTGLNPRGGPPRGGFEPSRMHGHAGEERKLNLELKLLADVGIVGMPNAGKSTLISRISAARPRIAAFPFTTVHPILGAVGLPSGRSVVAVDVPGLIEGASRGRGLGLEFLRHIERTRLLVHLVDMAGVDGRDPVSDYRALRQELEAYGKGVAEKAVILVANKMDLGSAKKQMARFKRETKSQPVSISAQTGEGIAGLLEQVTKKLERIGKNAGS